MARGKSNATLPGESRKLRHIFFVVLVFFVVIYSLAYSGIFSTDDEHILAAQALSFAFDDRINFSRVIGNERVHSYSLYSDPYAEQALNIEPAQAVIGSLLANIAAALDVGHVQALYLLNIWVTAITAAMVFLTVMRMGYSLTVGLVITAFFGLGTIAFPYSSTYFRDPLAMMFLTCAWYFMVALHQSSDELLAHRSQVVNWVGLVVSLTAGILSKNIVLITVPVVIFDILLNRKKRSFSPKAPRSLKKSRRVVWIALAAVFLLFCAVWVWVVPNLPVLARFTPAYYSTLVKFFALTPRPNFLEAVIGPLISPGKSLFIFSPILILSVWSLFFRIKTAWPGWTCLILMIIAQALFYDAEWSGHVNWGLRYLLPAVPLLLLTTVPAVDWLLKKTIGRVMLILLGFISLVIQLLGVLVPVGEYYSAMLLTGNSVAEWATIWTAQNSIFFWNARWLLSGGPWDLAFVRIPSSIILVSISAVAILGGVFLCWKLRRIEKLIWICVAACLVMNLLMLLSYRDDPIYETNRVDFKNAQAYILENGRPEENVLVRSYGTPAWRYWMNWAKPQIHWTALPYYFPVPSLVEKYLKTDDPEEGLSTNSLAILRESVSWGGTLWMVLSSDSPGAELSLEKVWLMNKSSEVKCAFFDDNGQSTEVCKFTLR